MLVEDVIAKIIPSLTSAINDSLQQIRKEFKEDRQELRQEVASLSNKIDALNVLYLSIQVADERNKSHEEFKADMNERWQNYEDDKKEMGNRSFNVSQSAWLLLASVVLNVIIFAIEKAIWH